MYKDILVPIDLNQESSWHKSLPTALAMCRTFGANLNLVTVVPDFGLSAVSQYFPPGTEKKMREEAATHLNQFIAEQVPSEIKTQPIVAEGSVYREILGAAKEISADLIVMASHRPEVSDYLLGANAAKVVRHAGCSVMVVRG
jgi:nucleotide-binding universal stress UspA family protein